MMHYLLQTKGLYQYIKPGYVHPPSTNKLEDEYIRIGVHAAIVPIAATLAHPATATHAATPALPAVPGEPV